MSSFCLFLYKMWGQRGSRTSSGSLNRTISWCNRFLLISSEPTSNLCVLSWLQLTLLLEKQLQVLVFSSASPALILDVHISLLLAEQLDTSWYRLGKGLFWITLFHSRFLNIGVGYCSVFGPPADVLSWIWVIHPHLYLHSCASPSPLNCQKREGALLTSLARILFEMHKAYWKPVLNTTH